MSVAVVCPYCCAQVMRLYAGQVFCSPQHRRRFELVNRWAERRAARRSRSHDTG